ncbi:hypothetical protein CWI36_0097p0020 [Hamiltosporidium magnivora]|uniref:Spindle pole body component n=1 Tax=Hamiltosporidium magnivora TaxID=148818 RepID=A0A4Q9LLI0_9MICR|nr:hypothetical protein CWI36_0097p0020 [Hamiltosporidium magnivora]
MSWISIILTLIFSHFSLNASFYDLDDKEIYLNVLEDTIYSGSSSNNSFNCSNSKKVETEAILSNDSIGYKNDLTGPRNNSDIEMKTEVDSIDCIQHIELLNSDLLKPLNKYNEYLLIDHELKVKVALDALKTVLCETNNITAFNFRYVFLKKTSNSIKTTNLSLKIRKHLVIINNVYRFFLLENDFLKELEQMYKKNDYQKTLIRCFSNIDPVFEYIINYIDEGIKKLYSNENFEFEYKNLKKSVLEYEFLQCTNVNNLGFHNLYIQNWNLLYSANFIEYWKQTILNILNLKNNYIYLILPEFRSFEIKLKAEINSIQLKNGSFFIAILVLKSLLNNPIIKTIQERFQAAVSKNKTFGLNHEECKWYLKNKHILRKHFMKVLKIFVISIEHNMFHSVLYTLERVIYYDFIRKKLSSNFLLCYHFLNIMNNVLFLMDKILVQGLFLYINVFVKSVIEEKCASRYRTCDENIFFYIDISIKRKILLLYIRLYESLFDRQMDFGNKKSGEQYNSIFLYFEDIKKFMETNNMFLILKSRRIGTEFCFNIDDLLLLSSCLIQRIYKLRFEIECFINLRNYFQRFFKN